MRSGIFDDSWIRTGVMKRKSNYSPVLCFETVDPKRIYQLKEYVLTVREAFRADKVLLYDPWDGLSVLKLAAEGPVAEPYKKSPSSQGALGSYIRADSGAVVLSNFRAVLKEVDPFLKNQTTVFIIQNVSEARESETGFQAAIRAWAIDPQILARGSTIIILTSDASRIMDEFTKEFAVIITVDPSSSEERKRLVDQIASELGLQDDPAKMESVNVTLSGLNLHQIESILLECYQRKKDFDLDVIKELKSETVKRSKVLEVRDPQWSFDDIGGYSAIKAFISKYIINVLKHPDRARRFGLGLPKGLLFFGPPGTGKSLFANALASEVRLPFINLVTENIYSKWLGESGQNMKNAIMLAEKMSPAIVFVDEIDRFGKRSGAASGSAEEETQRVFSQFLEWLGRPDRDAIIVGTTNVPEHLDEAFLRAGRLDYKIPFLYPGPQARLEVLAVHLGLTGKSRRPRVPLDMGEEETRSFLWDSVVPITRNFSCAELEELVTRAKRIAFDKERHAVTKEDLLLATKTFRIDSVHRRRVVESCLAQARRFTDDQSFLDAIEEENRTLENEDDADE